MPSFCKNNNGVIIKLLQKYKGIINDINLEQ